MYIAFHTLTFFPLNFLTFFLSFSWFFSALNHCFFCISISISLADSSFLCLSLNVDVTMALSVLSLYCLCRLSLFYGFSFQLCANDSTIDMSSFLSYLSSPLEIFIWMSNRQLQHMSKCEFIFLLEPVHLPLISIFRECFLLVTHTRNLSHPGLHPLPFHTLSPSPSALDFSFWPVCPLLVLTHPLSHRRWW